MRFTMKAHRVQSRVARCDVVTCAMLAASLLVAACSGIGEIGDANRTGGSPGTSGGQGGAGMGSTGTGGTQVVDPTKGGSTSWYETLKATNCSAAPAALPPTRIWRLSAPQWKN